MKYPHRKIGQRIYIGIILFFTVMILPSSIIAQGWQTAWDTGIEPEFQGVNGEYYDKITAYADKDGIHVLTHANDGGAFTTMYYLFDDTGNLVRSTTHGSMVAAELSGIDNTIVIMYIDNSTNQIKGKKSTNAGQSWSSITAKDMEGTVDQFNLTAASDSKGIHVSHDDDGGAYYRLYNQVTNVWENLGTISTDAQTPWVATSSDRAHFAYDGSNSDVNSRSYNHSTESWETEQDVEGAIPYVRRSVIVDAAKEYVFYSQLFFMSWELFEKRRDINSSTWSDEISFTEVNFSGASPVLTEDGIVHILYEASGVMYRYMDSGSWTNELTIDGINGSEDHVELAGSGNDLYALWVEYDGADNTMRIRWKDEAPVAPQNVLVVDDPGGVLITWDPVNTPDLKQYRVYRNSTKIATVGKNVTSWVDCKVDGGSGPSTFHYKVKAMDDGDKLSPFSASSSINGAWAVCGSFKMTHKGSGNIPEGFSLKQNVPNPFNPETTISFELPKASNVKVEIYNIRGELMQTLTDGILSAGNHKLRWNGKDEFGNLSPSGVYIYRLKAVDLESGESYQAVRKMTLLR